MANFSFSFVGLRFCWESFFRALPIGSTFYSLNLSSLNIWCSEKKKVLNLKLQAEQTRSLKRKFRSMFFKWMKFIRTFYSSTLSSLSHVQCHVCMCPEQRKLPCFWHVRNIFRTMLPYKCHCSAVLPVRCVVANYSFVLKNFKLTRNYAPLAECKCGFLLPGTAEAHTPKYAHFLDSSAVLPATLWPPVMTAWLLSLQQLQTWPG